MVIKRKRIPAVEREMPNSFWSDGINGEYMAREAAVKKTANISMPIIRTGRV
jgi:hypothetical protein